ncbi:MAG: type II secretion system protein [Dehalococcoidia bacterium]|nr:type II secretion system protein [Dehalococcoidia bacterium]
MDVRTGIDMYHEKEAGYSLVELLAVIGILGFLAAAMALTFATIANVGSRNNAQSIAMTQVNQAGQWISTDVQSAENVTAGSSGTWLCSLNRYNWTGASFATEKIDYEITDGKMMRKVNDNPGPVVAEFISGPGTDTSFTVVPGDNNTFVLTIKAVFNTASYSKVYRINRRMGG